ncbi:hypothetical protein [Oryzomonas rubra]|uniref:Uncharacterized protein n=1 Tax=Oryzomonas rubra TaxID=2509454 RepID=A0A5A9X8B6_9BACT|nr:hypothetical protein [Oryzomonas rubra]KAA0888708.1 hypothetical protein ET418_15115 [Oryzomonas rubra]
MLKTFYMLKRLRKAIQYNCAIRAEQLEDGLKLEVAFPDPKTQKLLGISKTFSLQELKDCKSSDDALVEEFATGVRDAIAKTWAMP